MDAERAREFLRKLPLVEETMQWGGNLVYWVGDKAVGGKMFALVNLEADGRERVLSFSAGPERFHELVENDGVFPAPYMARLHWVALKRWNALPGRELEGLLRDARDLTYAKLPARIKETLALPAKEYEKVLNARKKLLAEKILREAAAKSTSRPAKKKAAGTRAKST